MWMRMAGHVCTDDAFSLSLTTPAASTPSRFGPSTTALTATAVHCSQVPLQTAPPGSARSVDAGGVDDTTGPPRSPGLQRKLPLPGVRPVIEF